MRKFTLAILGNNYKETTKFMENLIQQTKAQVDQDHMKMNIIISKNLLEKKEEELINILNNLEKMDSSYLVLTFNNQKIYQFIQKNTKIKVLNSTFSLEDKALTKEILTLFYNAEELWKKLELLEDLDPLLQ